MLQLYTALCTACPVQVPLTPSSLPNGGALVAYHVPDDLLFCFGFLLF